MPVFTGVILDHERNPIYVNRITEASSTLAWDVLVVLIEESFPHAGAWELWDEGQKVMAFYNRHKSPLKSVVIKG